MSTFPHLSALPPISSSYTLFVLLQVNMEELYCFDAATKLFSKCEVKTVGKPRDPVLRIR
jgi:hypothetical protein